MTYILINPRLRKPKNTKGYISFRVLEPPQITHPHGGSNIFVNEGEDVRVSCTALGDPRYVICIFSYSNSDSDGTLLHFLTHRGNRKKFSGTFCYCLSEQKERP